jgi:hydrophobe/amphiphile efflux-1 (HAE1) family protein
MILSDISIKKPVFAWMLMAGLLVFGAISYTFMGISQLPDVDFPVVTVSVSWAGASPDVMESAVADIIENAVMSVDGIQLVQSTSQQGQSQITIQFNLQQDINVALQQVQTKISQAQKNLPQTIDPPVITKTNPNDQPIMWTAAYSEQGNLRDLALFVRDHLKDVLTTINGVGDVTMGGYVDPQMRIWLHAKEMKRHEITAQDVIDAVNQEHQLAPTGFQDHANTETYIRVHSEFTDAKGCYNLIIPARAGLPNWVKTKIGDVATCEESTDDVRRISRFDGIMPTIGLGIIKQHGTNAVAIGDAVKKKVEKLKEILPKGMNMGVVTDTTVFIKDSINELLFTLCLAVILTAVVCYLFLGTLSSAFNVILAIPVSLIGSFIVLNALGFTINTFVLMGLSLSIGIVVDDAIMVLENITRHNEMGKSRVHAALVGAREITGAATAASLAILAIFIPVIFMQGIVGKFFYQFGVTMSVAVMISLLEALTLAPMRCSQFLEVGGGNFVTQKVNKWMDQLEVSYKKSLHFCLNHRWQILGVSTGIFVVSILTIQSLRKEFIPPQDQSRFLVTLYTKMGSSMEYTDSVFREAEKLYKSRPEIEHYYVAVGGFGGGLVNQGITFVTMKDIDKRPIANPFAKAPSQQEFMAYLRGELAKIPGVQRAAILDLSLTGFSAQRGYPIEFVIQGPDWEKLADLAAQMREKMKTSGLMADVDTDYNPNMPELEIFPNRSKAAERGVPITSITNTIAAMVGGMKLLPNKYTDASGHRDDIKVKLDNSENLTEEDIYQIGVRNIQREIIPLSQVVDIEKGNTLLTITRFNRERGISIFGNFTPGKSQSEVMDYAIKTAKEILPEGYHLVPSGSSQAFNDSFRSLIGALILGIFVAYIVLASQFNSFIHPVVILLALPFSLTGALWAMRISDTSMNIYSLIGILLLMGIVKKNSILLVEFTNHKRAEGLGVREALIEACPMRLRPILMTSIATVAGALPEAIASGAGAETIRPMAIAVVGGVTVSTFLTLFVVPCAYSLMSRLESKKHEGELRAALVAMGEKFAAQSVVLLATSVFAGTLMLSSPAYAMDAFEIQVYSSEINSPGKLSLETHLNTVLSGLTSAESPGMLPNNHMTHLTFEFAAGMNSYLELGAYLQTAYAEDGIFRYAGAKLRSKLVVPREQSGPWLLGCNFEVSNIPPEFEASRWGSEIRPIIGLNKDVWTFVVNPILGIDLSSGKSATPDLSPAAKVMANAGHFSGHGFALGAEYYLASGSIHEMKSLPEAEQYLFATFDLVDGPIELDIGLGRGLNSSSNPSIGKMIAGFDF